MSLLRKRHQCFSSLPLDFCLLNTRSGSNRGDGIVKFVTDNDLDILALTVTWFKPEHVVGRGDITPAGYTLATRDHVQGRSEEAELPFYANVKKAKRCKVNTFESIHVYPVEINLCA